MHLNKKALGLAVGVLAGAVWFIMIAGALLFGWMKSAVMLLGPLHPGFAYSWGGAVWMAVLHLVVGYVLGYVLAWLYNKSVK
ncbi:MAG: hypothetical protein Q7R98_00895 [Candidatus Jorgensenbacteria bacterium]|nr:hypothetical protein [Candidatus Jorgensenbacteria bacterium]